MAAKLALLSGGNPQIAKAEGNDAVQAYIAAIPGWKRDIGRRLDALVTRAVPGVKRVHVASGVRMDLAARDDAYVEELAKHHVGGHLKVAPEHTSDVVLTAMKKPPQHTFEAFAAKKKPEFEGD